MNSIASIDNIPVQEQSNFTYIKDKISSESDFETEISFDESVGSAHTDDFETALGPEFKRFEVYKFRMDRKKGLQKENSIDKNSLDFSGNFYKPEDETVFGSFADDLANKSVYNASLACDSMMGQCRIRKDLLKGLMSTPEYESSRRLKQILKKSVYATEKAPFNDLDWCQK